MDGKQAILRSYRIFQDKSITILAAGVAYYAFFSIFSIVLLTVALGSLVGGEAFAQQIVRLVEGQLSQPGVSVVEHALESPAGLQGASLLGILALAWSSLRVFRTLDLSFDAIYRANETTSLPRQILNALIVLGALALAATLLIAVDLALGLDLTPVPYPHVVSVVTSLIAITAILLLFYRVMPPISVPFREVLPGAGFATVGWLLFHRGFRLYAQHADRYQALGFLGAVLLFLVWLYLSSMIVLLGAVLNAVLASRD